MLIWTLATASAVFVCWLFATASLHKLNPANADYYRRIAGNYGFGADDGLSKNHFQKIGIQAVGILEAVTAIAILIPQSRHIGAALALAILVGYTVLIAKQVIQGRTGLDCGCSGPAGTSLISPALIGRNMMLCLIASIPLLTANTAAGASPAFWVLAIAQAAFMTLLYLGVEQLHSNAQRLTIFASKH